MKRRKIAVFLTTLLTASVLTTGCSFTKTVTGVVEDVTGTSGPTETLDSSSLDGIEFDSEEVDPNITAPVFDTDLGGAVNVLAGGSTSLSVSASAPEGDITYQWYSTNTNTNGGGTLIQGADQQTFSPDCSTPGTVFYYVLASAHVNGKVNMSVSSVAGVTVWAQGNWQKDETTGGYRYIVQADGSFPTDVTMEINGIVYTFNGEGYAVDEAGAYVTPADAPAAVTAASGDAQTEEAPAEQAPAEEVPAEEAPAEEAPAEETPAEETPAEEAPAEEAPAEQQTEDGAAQ
ncbi:MAG: hypothetical protein U0L49_02960 [Eubacterium sp.]|nr:hypothetical protein [Eubacterium sp.]